MEGIKHNPERIQRITEMPPHVQLVISVHAELHATVHPTLILLKSHSTTLEIVKEKSSILLEYTIL